MHPRQVHFNWLLSHQHVEAVFADTCRLQALQDPKLSLARSVAIFPIPASGRGEIRFAVLLS